MKENKLEDKTIFECLVSLNDNEFDTLLTLTENHLLFQKKKGIFQKKYKVIKDILVNDVKVINDKVKIEEKKNKITIYTQNDEYNFTCKNTLEAKKVIEKINEVVLKEGLSERISKKVVKTLKRVKKTAVVVSEIVGISFGIYKIFDEMQHDLDNK